jgi:2-keto-4-pentenoate hydratase/2-oxohepta-3-ene-1,7-dioic acid hydratase in catechol pathway
MKLVTFRDKAGDHVGALVNKDTNIIDLKVAAKSKELKTDYFKDMLTLIEGGDVALDLARTAEKHGITTGSGLIKKADVNILAPVPRPLAVRDYPCFEEHMKGTNAKMIKEMIQMAPQNAEALKMFFEFGESLWYKRPPVCKWNPLNVVGPDTDILWPSYAQMLDYELEFGLFIGKKGKDIERSKAMEYVFGYTVFNDFTARDECARELFLLMGLGRGKDFDTSEAMGPCIVTADSFNPYTANMIVRVNGEERGRNNSSTMYWKFEDLIVHYSQSQTLYPGEFFGSGTCGKGAGIEIGQLLKPGDVVELEVECIGILRNRIVKP